MNINKITTSILAACTMTLTSCNFSEDDCPRHCVLRAWADFDKISQTEIPAPTDRHLMAFGTRYDDIPSATFSADTLFWSLPRDTYQFIYYTGNYKTEETCCPFKMKLTVPTTTVDGKECIAYKQPYCSTAMFEREIYYQQTTDAEIIPTQFVQRINLKVNVIGEDQTIEAIHSGLDSCSVMQNANGFCVNISERDLDCYIRFWEYSCGRGNFPDWSIIIVRSNFKKNQEESLKDLARFFKEYIQANRIKKKKKKPKRKRDFSL